MNVCRIHGGSLALLMMANPLFATDSVSTDLFQSGNRQDGWYSWQVAAIDAMPAWCCFFWKTQSGGSHTGENGVCDLDRKNHGFSSSDLAISSSSEIQIYARLEQGRITDLRPLSPACEVRSKNPVIDLGLVETAQSLSWLQADGLSDELEDDQRLLTIAAHAGPEAGEILWQSASEDDDLETRKSAVFWMAQLRIAESGERLQQLIKSDSSAELREHAVFSYTQSEAADRVEVLIEIIENRKLQLSDRSNALFWLAESGSEQGIDYIQQLLIAEVVSGSE